MGPKWHQPDQATRRITRATPRRRVVRAILERQEASAAMMNAEEHDREDVSLVPELGLLTIDQTARLDRAFQEQPPTPPSHTQEECAATVLAWVSGIDPAWKERLQVMQDERGLNPMQALGACVAYVLENALQMVIVTNEAFESNDYRRGDHMCCRGCEKEFRPAYPLQPFCTNACADQFRAAQKG